jgi:hypothetical protein
MLLNKQDFNEKVGQDVANLCCVLVTSTLCRQCGIRRIPYPKPPRRNADGAAAHGEGEEGEGDDNDAAEDVGTEDADGDAAAGTRSVGGGGDFYRNFETHLVQKASTAVQRRHVRFFHVCACAEQETCIDFLVASDPAYSLLNRMPTAQEVAQLHQTAHQQLHELLTSLGVRSTPFMRFYLGGQPLRYSMMPADADTPAMGGITEANDLIMATGSNYVKWARVLENAVVVRNVVMREYDAGEREKARLERAEQRRLAHEARQRQDAEEGDEEGED